MVLSTLWYNNYCLTEYKETGHHERERSVSTRGARSLTLRTHAQSRDLVRSTESRARRATRAASRAGAATTPAASVDSTDESKSEISAASDAEQVTP
jgi:hypothetical protein